MSWFEQNMPGGGWSPSPEQPYMPPGYQPGIDDGGLPYVRPPDVGPTAGAATKPEAQPIDPGAPQFNVQGAQVHGRAADTHDLNDLIYIASQQQGFDTSTPEATKRTFESIFKPLLAQQGFGGAQLIGNNLDKISVGGRVIDFAGNAAGGERRLQAVEDGGPGSGGGMNLAAMGGPDASVGGYLPLGGGGAAGVGNAGAPAGSGGNGGWDESAALHREFTLPTLADAQADPGYQFGLQEGIGALENSASAHGMLRHPNTREGMVRFGTDYATTKYNDLVQRQLAAAGFNDSGTLNEYQARIGTELGRGNLGVANANVGLGYYRAGNDFNLGLGQLALGNKQADNSYSLGAGSLGLGWAGHNLAADSQTFNQGYSMSRLGLDAAAIAGGYGGQYANNAGQYLTGQGNANAAGAMGAANAWSAAAGTIGNAAMGAAGYYSNPYR